MSHLELEHNGRLGEGKVILDSIDISNLVTGISIDAEAEAVGRAFIKVVITSCSINSDGIVELNNIPVSDEIGRAVYEDLKKIYE